jgi:hypothetical protein
MPINIFAHGERLQLLIVVRLISLKSVGCVPAYKQQILELWS